MLDFNTTPPEHATVSPIFSLVDSINIHSALKEMTSIVSKQQLPRFQPPLR